MSSSNIHAPSALLAQASVHVLVTDQATFYPFNKPVLIVSGPFSQDDVDGFRWCLRSNDTGCWLQNHGMRISTTNADDQLDIPQIRVGPGLAQPSEDDGIHYWPYGAETKYVIIIQGRSGASKAKVMISNTLEQAAATMMHEALNGYSTVFSASYVGLPRDDTMTSRGNMEFEIAHELKESHIDQGRGGVRVIYLKGSMSSGMLYGH